MGQAERAAPEMTAALRANLELSGPISFIFMMLAWKDFVAVLEPGKPPPRY